MRSNISIITPDKVHSTMGVEIFLNKEDLHISNDVIDNVINYFRRWCYTNFLYNNKHLGGFHQGNDTNWQYFEFFNYEGNESEIINLADFLVGKINDFIADNRLPIKKFNLEII
jgi:hypothetical protein